MANKKNSHDYTGYIRKRKNGIWEGQYLFQGTRKSIYGKTKEEVRSKLNTIYSNILNNTHVEESADTLAFWLNKWLKEYTADIRPSTYASYETYIRAHINPCLGSIKLRHLKIDRLQAFFNEKAVSGLLNGRSGGLSPKSLRNIRNMLNEALTQACKNELLSMNPLSGVKLPQKEQKEQRVLNEVEFKSLLAVAEASSHPVAKGIIILLMCGLRKGELLGLQNQSINLSDSSIFIRRNLTRMQHPSKSDMNYMRIDDWADAATKTGIYLGPVKTKKGNRKIYLPKKALKAINCLMAYQKEISHGCADGTFNPHGFLLVNEYGRPFDPKTFEVYFNRFVAQAGLERTNIHATRHTFATKALQKMPDVNTVSDILGHAKPSTTFDMYGHTFDERKKKMMELFDD